MSFYCHVIELYIEYENIWNSYSIFVFIFRNFTWFRFQPLRPLRCQCFATGNSRGGTALTAQHPVAKRPNSAGNRDACRGVSRHKGVPSCWVLNSAATVLEAKQRTQSTQSINGAVSCPATLVQLGLALLFLMGCCFSVMGTLSPCPRASDGVKLVVHLPDHRRSVLSNVSRIRVEDVKARPSTQRWLMGKFTSLTCSIHAFLSFASQSNFLCISEASFGQEHLMESDCKNQIIKLLEYIFKD